MSDRNPKQALSTLKAGASALLPIYPQTFEDVARLARMACIGGMVKPLKIGYGDNAETEAPNATEARATMILLQGMELGVPPMVSLQLFAMINGRITAHSEAVPGLLLSKGFKIKQKYEGTPFEDDFAAVCTLTRPDGDSVVSRYSVKDAKDAGLWSPDAKVTKNGKGGTTYQADNDSAWHRFPKRMLWARALGFAAKDKGADAMKGLMVREEMEDMLRERVVDVTPERIEAATVDEIPEIPPVENEAVQEIHETTADDAPIIDASGLLAKLKDEFSGQADEAIRMEIWDAHSDLIARMSDVDQRAAQAIYEGRA